MRKYSESNIGRVDSAVLVIAGGTYVFGAEKVTLEVVEGFKDRGYKVEALISGWNDGKFSKALDKIGVKYHKLKLGWYYRSKLLWSLDSLVHYPGAIFRYLSIRKKYRGWLAYVTSFRQVVLLGRFLKNKIVFHVHDVNSNNKRSVYFIRKIDRKVTKYIAVSEFIKADLEKIGVDPDKIEVVHNGIEILSGVNGAHLNNVVTLGIVGQVIERKGHMHVLHALKKLRDGGMMVNLKIVGSGDDSYIDNLKKYAAENNLSGQIEWAGFIADPDGIYDGIDILLALTITPEPFGLIAIEANMRNIPVIAADSGGFRETIVDGYNGYLVDPFETDAVAAKVQAFLNDRSLLKSMGENGRKRVVENFTNRQMVDKIDKILAAL